jgi:hypothetical protein
MALLVPSMAPSIQASAPEDIAIAADFFNPLFAPLEALGKP